MHPDLETLVDLHHADVGMAADSAPGIDPDMVEADTAPGLAARDKMLQKYAPKARVRGPCKGGGSLTGV